MRHFPRIPAAIQNANDEPGHGDIPFQGPAFHLDSQLRRNRWWTRCWPTLTWIRGKKTVFGPLDPDAGRLCLGENVGLMSALVFDRPEEVFSSG
jgi:hypothetical protein